MNESQGSKFLLIKPYLISVEKRSKGNPSELSADMDHGSAGLHKAWLANVVTLFFMRHCIFDDAHKIFVGAAGT